MICDLRIFAEKACGCGQIFNFKQNITMNFELSTEQLRKNFDPKALGIKSTESFGHLKGIIGQKRAVSALRFGLHIQGNNGFNVYVAGPPGIGKMTSVKAFLEEVASRKPTPPDWCYVNNFEDAYSPKVIQLPPGRGCEFKQDMSNLVDHIRRELPKVFESDEYGNRRDEIVNELTKQSETLSDELNQRASEKGFILRPTPMGIMFIPIRDGQPIQDEQFKALPESERSDFEQRRQALYQELKGTMKKVRQIERQGQEKVKELDRRVALNIVGGVLDDLVEKYEQFPKIIEHLKEVRKDILENIETFKITKQNQSGSNASAPGNPQMQLLHELNFRKYQVNVLVDNCKQEGAPVIVELNPTYNNLLGRIEKEMEMGVLNTDFTLIKAGALPLANGGFLVLPVEEVLRSLYSYDGLKRSLRAGEVQIEELGERLGFLAFKSLRPEPIPLDVKVVLVGSPLIYHLLHAYDEVFPELFKVKADFDTRMAFDDDNIKNLVAFISTYCEKHKLKHFDGQATARMLEHASRLADDQEKLSTKFGNLADVICEANYWAQQDEASLVSAKHVQKALDEKVFRSNLLQERIQEMIARGMILIDIEAKTVGQVNGLSVLNLGDYMFGKPSRITASVSPGREGVIDIEREVELGGPIHSKGVLILGGYISKKFAHDRPLTLASRLVFEQSYEGVEGDSASSAELYAILSALAEAPIKQGIAVTGSVNQHGEIQAIGGVNQKIEGFFDVCKLKGLTGDQGVIIPHSNVQHLMLREDVVAAVRERKFHLYAVKTIDEGIGILAGEAAGEQGTEGKFPKDTINERVRLRLREFEETLKAFREPREKERLSSRKTENRRLKN